MRRIETSFWSTWAVTLLVLALLVLALSEAATFPAYGDLQPYSDPEALAKRGFRPDMASNAHGEVVIVWEARGSLQARIFDSTGEARGNSVAIPGVSVSFPLLPAVAMDQRGRFVLAWRYDSIFPDPNAPNGHVFLQLFDPEANPVGATFQAFPFDLHVSGFPRLTMAPDGSFWVAARKNASEIEGSFFLRRFDIQGTPLTEPSEVSAPTQHHVQFPLLAMAPDGRLAILTSDCDFDSCTNSRLRALVLDPSGAPLGDEVELTDQGFGHGVTWVPGQGFVAVWWRPAEPDLPSESQAFAIEGRSFSEDSMGEVFVVKEESEGDGKLPRDVDLGLETQAKVAADPLGNLVVTWEEELNPNTETGIYARALDAQLQVQGPIVEVSAGAGQRALLPVLAPLGPGRFSLAWTLISGPGRVHLFEQKFLVTGDDCVPASTTFCLQQALPPATRVTMEGNGFGS